MPRRVVDSRLVGVIKQHKKLFDEYIDDVLAQENERIRVAQDWTTAARIQGRIQMIQQFARDFDPDEKSNPA